VASFAALTYRGLRRRRFGSGDDFSAKLITGQPEISEVFIIPKFFSG
jgi:hypothetical protein